MKREILFKGKIKYNGNHLFSGDWAYGSLIIKSSGVFLYVIEKDDYGNILREFEVEVIPETVCQFTGFYAKNKKSNLDSKIFEDDIFRGFNADEEEIYYVVMWIVPRGAFYMVPIEHHEIIKNHNVSEEEEFSWLFDDALLYDFALSVVVLTKVGNIHDNPELINK